MSVVDQQLHQKATTPNAGHLKLKLEDSQLVHILGEAGGSFRCFLITTLSALLRWG